MQRTFHLLIIGMALSACILLFLSEVVQAESGSTVTVSGTGSVEEIEEAEESEEAEETEESPSASSGSMNNPEPDTPIPDTPIFSILITEILANPEGSDAGNEWIEIANLGDVPVQISGWTLSDEKTSFTFEDTIVEPGEHQAYFSTGTKISLKNTGESVTLSSGSTIIDTLTYPEALDAISFGRQPARSRSISALQHRVSQISSQFQMQRSSCSRVSLKQLEVRV